MSKKTVMICDDEPDLLMLYRRALEPRYDVIAVDSGKGCIERYIAEKGQGKKIDVLLLDYRLGDILGDSVACEISKLNGVKTLLISAYDLDENLVSDLKARGCIVGTIKKPAKLVVILQRIEQLLVKSD